MKKIFSFVAASLFAASMWAAVGPQSIQVTFNGSDAEGWKASSGGSITSVAAGVANVQMASQGGTPEKYRADMQHQEGGFTFDKSKDIVWAIKLTTALPGSANSRKFEINYKNAENEDKWINGISGPSGDINCNDGGKIYYFDLGAMGKLDAVQEGSVTINKIHFIMADAVCESAEEAVYAVDWIATFTSVNDLKTFADWSDDEMNLANSYLELLFRPKADGSGYDQRRNGFKETEMEGNYSARMFCVEYFLVENFNAAKDYKLEIVTVGAGGTYPMAIWNFPYQVNYETPAADMNAYAVEIVGHAPGTDGELNTPLGLADCQSSIWSFTIPGASLTQLATYGNKTLVGFLVTSYVHGSDEKCKYASLNHATLAAPSLTVVDGGSATAFGNTAVESKAIKMICNGQVLIVRDGHTYNALGVELK